MALPIGAIVFATGAGNALREIGKGDFAMEHEMPQGGSGGGGEAPVSSAVREEEIRQMVTARSYRREARGESALDVDAEVEKLLAPEREAGSLGQDRGLREEVRQLVVARNERRKRQGKKALNVEKEIERQLRELENLANKIRVMEASDPNREQLESDAADSVVELDEVLTRPGTYFNPQTGVLVGVDDSASCGGGLQHGGLRGSGVGADLG